MCGDKCFNNYRIAPPPVKFAKSTRHSRVALTWGSHRNRKRPSGYHGFLVPVKWRIFGLVKQIGSACIAVPDLPPWIGQFQLTSMG